MCKLILKLLPINLLNLYQIVRTSNFIYIFYFIFTEVVMVQH